MILYGLLVCQECVKYGGLHVYGWEDSTWAVTALIPLCMSNKSVEILETVCVQQHVVLIPI